MILFPERTFENQWATPFKTLDAHLWGTATLRTFRVGRVTVEIIRSPWRADQELPNGAIWFRVPSAHVWGALHRPSYDWNPWVSVNRLDPCGPTCAALLRKHAGKTETAFKAAVLSYLIPSA